MSQDPYQVLSQIYDQDVHLDIPRAFFRTLRPLIAAHRRGPPILDLGCGSGLLTERIARLGAHVVGIDGSRPMLDLARKRCRAHRDRVSLVLARLDGFRVTTPARLAVTCGDVVNHFSSSQRLLRFFRATRRALSAGGSFVFDTVTEHCFEHLWPDNTHVLEGPLGDVVMTCDWDPVRKRGTAKFRNYVRRSARTFSRETTVLHEYYYSDSQILRALAAAGFSHVWRRSWSPWRRQDCDSQEGSHYRHLWYAKKEGATGTSVRVSPRSLGFRRVRLAGR